MLQQMREWFRYLKWVLIVVVFMFIVWAFASWTGAVFGVRQDTGAWASQVNETTIEAQTFQSYARQLDSTYQSMFGEQYAQQRGLMRVGRQAIERLVEDELLYQEAQRRGLRVGPEEVAQVITRDPSFQENGQFIGVERYRSLFQGSRITVAQFEDSIRRRLLTEKYRRIVGAGVAISDAAVEEELLRRNQKATVDYLLIDPAGLPARPAPAESDLARYHEEHRDRYLRGEGRTGFYVLLTPAEVAPSAEPTDAEVQAAYDRDRASRYTVREQRRASHILLKVPSGANERETARIESRAKTVLKRARSGADFAALARAHSEDSTAGSGGDLSFFGRGQMVKEFEDAAFSLPVGSVSDLVRTTYGFHIIKVTDTKPSREMPLDEVRDRIREEIRMTRSRTQIQERATSLAAAAAGGRLQAAAESQGLGVSETGPVHSGDALPKVPASQAVVAEMLALQPGEVSRAIPIPSGQVIVQVTGSVPDEPQPLSSVRARVEKDLGDERLLASVKERMRGASGGGLQPIARLFKGDVKTQSDLSRGAPIPGVPQDPAIEQQIETLSPGSTGDPILTSAGVLILSVRERNDHREAFDGQRDAARDALSQQERDRLLRAVVRRLREQGKVTVNDSLVDAVDRS
jgi:peptidyl-prolyl cis-trans isomerase D